VSARGAARTSGVCGSCERDRLLRRKYFEVRDRGRRVPDPKVHPGIVDCHHPDRKRSGIVACDLKHETDNRFGQLFAHGNPWTAKLSTPLTAESPE
jgi:hypothetical protein